MNNDLCLSKCSPLLLALRDTDICVSPQVKNESFSSGSSSSSQNASTALPDTLFDKENTIPSSSAVSTPETEITFKVGVHTTPKRPTFFKPRGYEERDGVFIAGLTELKDSKGTPELAAAPADVTSEKYAAIACLDEEDEAERWRERAAIITKCDHESNVRYAREFLVELVAAALSEDVDDASR